MSTDDFEQIDHFEILEPLGQGSFSTVYRALDQKHHRLVALKVLRPSIQSDESTSRFKQEAVVAAKVVHPNVVRLYEAGVSDGRYYIAFELVDGVSLRDWLGFLKPGEIELTRLMKSICDGVAAAHEAGIVHRDLKPENVIIDLTGDPKITDFGLASLPDNRLTCMHTSIGTVAYMSPEQAGGKSAHVTPESDVFSLGVMLFEAITGQLPIQAATNAEYLCGLMNRDIVSLQDFDHSVSRDLSAIVSKCLSNLPRYRYSDASHLAADLGRFAKAVPTYARPLSTIEHFFRAMRKHWLASLLSGAAITSLLVATGVSVKSYMRAEQDRQKQVRITNTALQATVDAICKIRPSELSATLVNAKSVSSAIEPLLRAKALRGEFNASLAVISLYDRSQIELSQVIRSLIAITDEEFETAIGTLQAIDSEMVEAELNGLSESGSRHSLVSLLLGTGALAEQHAAIDVDQSDRYALVDEIAGIECFSELVFKRLTASDSPSIISAILTGVAEWQTNLEPHRSMFENFASASESLVRSAARYAITKRGLTERSKTTTAINFCQIGDGAYISATEFTFGQIEHLSEQPPIAAILAERSALPPGRGGVSNDYPITSLSLDEIKAVCDALSISDGLAPYYSKQASPTSRMGYRLPTLAEWRIAAASDSRTRYFFGDSSEAIGKYGHVVTEFSSQAMLMPVALRRPNALGIFDVYGNAGEAVHLTAETTIIVGGSSWSIREECLPQNPQDFHPSVTVGFRIFIQEPRKDQK
jgi:serine/threonine protein kinase